MREGDPPLVSVVMPVFNHPPYRLRRAVQSILNQTYPRLELIIADGNPTDVNLKVIEEFDDSGIVYCKAKGYIDCLNLGIQKATGAYVARMDSDDISLPQRLEEQVRFLEQNPCVGLCSCQAERFGDVEPYITEFPENVDFITCVKTGGVLHPAMMFRRELNVKYEHIKPVEDCLLFRRLLLDGCVIKNVDKVLFKSRENKTSIMARHPKLMARYLAKINLDAFDRFPRLRGILSFSEKVFEKKSFSAADFASFFAFVREMKRSDAADGLDPLAMFRPYLDYMVSHCENKPAAYFKMLASREFRETYRPAHALLRRIFSVRNKRSPDGRKTKVVTILSVDIVIKKL